MCLGELDDFAAHAQDEQGISPTGNPFRIFPNGNSLEVEPNNDFKPRRPPNCRTRSTASSAKKAILIASNLPLKRAKCSKWSVSHAACDPSWTP